MFLRKHLFFRPESGSPLTCRKPVALRIPVSLGDNLEKHDSHGFNFRNNRVSSIQKTPKMSWTITKIRNYCWSHSFGFIKELCEFGQELCIFSLKRRFRGSSAAYPCFNGSIRGAHDSGIYGCTAKQGNSERNSPVPGSAKSYANVWLDAP